MRALLFSVGDELFAAPLSAVSESVDTPRVVPVPGSDAHIRGVIDLRGRRIPAYSPAASLNLELDGAPGAALILEGAPEAALLVSDVEDVLEIDESAMVPAPGAADPDGVLLGVVLLGGRLVSLVDPAAIRDVCLAANPAR